VCSKQSRKQTTLSPVTGNRNKHRWFEREWLLLSIFTSSKRLIWAAAQRIDHNAFTSIGWSSFDRGFRGFFWRPREEKCDQVSENAMKRNEMR
jgi:hypothetical protein